MANSSSDPASTKEMLISYAKNYGYEAHAAKVMYQVLTESGPAQPDAVEENIIKLDAACDRMGPRRGTTHAPRYIAGTEYFWMSTGRNRVEYLAKLINLHREKLLAQTGSSEWV